MSEWKSTTETSTYEPLLAKLTDDIREAEKALRDIEQNRFILIGKLQALRAVEAMLK